MNCRAIVFMEEFHEGKASSEPGSRKNRLGGLGVGELMSPLESEHSLTCCSEKRSLKPGWGTLWEVTQGEELGGIDLPASGMMLQ